MAAITNHWNNHLLVSSVVRKDSLESVTQLEKVSLSGNLAFKKLRLKVTARSIDALGSLCLSSSTDWA